MLGVFAVALAGLGDRSRREALKLGDGSFEVLLDTGAALRAVDGVFSDFEGLERLSGVWV